MGAVEARSDVFVIGAGPVGLATAIAARQAGLSVIVADSRTPPIDKACGEGLLPDGLPAARQLGIEPEGYPIRGIRFLSGNQTVEADFPEGSGTGVRRVRLHQQLVARAEALGVEFRWNHPVSNLESCCARWIVGADGTSSPIRTMAGLDHFHGMLSRFGFRKHFRIAPWTGSVEIYWGPGCQIYVTPVATDEVGVALISRNPRLRVDEALRYFPDLQGRLSQAECSSNERGAITGTRALARVTTGNIALVGDASGMVDAITGEGLGLGFHQALALADAMVRGDLRLYQRAHRKLARRPRLMARLLLALDQSDSARSLAIPVMAAVPVIFEKLLALHVGAFSTR